MYWLLGIFVLEVPPVLFLRCRQLGSVQASARDASRTKGQPCRQIVQQRRRGLRTRVAPGPRVLLRWRKAPREGASGPEIPSKHTTSEREGCDWKSQLALCHLLQVCGLAQVSSSLPLLLLVISWGTISSWECCGLGPPWISRPHVPFLIRFSKTEPKGKPDFGLSSQIMLLISGLLLPLDSLRRQRLGWSECLVWVWGSQAVGVVLVLLIAPQTPQ